MTVVGQVIGLWRYPVKSMLGEALTQTEVDEFGIPFDRGWGVIDAGTGLLLSAKRVPALLGLKAFVRFDGEVTIYADRGGRVVASDDDDVHDWLSDFLGRPVTLERPVVGEARRIEIEVDGDSGTDVFEFSTRPGFFFDTSSTMHVLTNASIQAAAGGYPGGAWNVERFRPEILIDTGTATGWIEDDWVGQDLQVGGPQGVQLHVRKPCQRCVLVTRGQGPLAPDKKILQTLATHHESNLGVYCIVNGIGMISVGDDVSVIPAG